MPNRIVIGSQWGDEGKAKIVDFLTDDAEVIIRFQGGANAGHTVVVGDQEFIFHLIPSGIMHDDKICVIGNGVVLDPRQILEELKDIEAKGISTEGRLKIADNAQVVLPYHWTLDRLKEEAAGKGAIGTTGRGIGPCYSDKVNRLGIRAGDLLDKDGLRTKLERMAAAKDEEFKKMYNAEPLDMEQIYQDYLELADKIAPFICDTTVLVAERVAAGENLIFEGAQGTSLDVDHGTYPYVTSSNTVAGSACCGAGVGPTVIDQVVGVVKAYTTRVGNGPFPTELDDVDGETLRSVGAEFGATTGRKRRCGWFDAPVVRKASMVNGLTHLALTKLDVLDKFETIKVCISYMLDGKEIMTIPNSLSDVQKVEPVYVEYDGWMEDTTKCRKWDELPEKAQVYLKVLADLVNVKIGMVSVGPGRDETIVVDMD
jgi:adenylosuccinate synthase